MGHPVVSKSWEGFVIENIISILPPRVRPYFYRTAGGAEIDLILEFGIDEKWAIEIKKGSSFSMERGFHEACEDIEPDKKFIIYAGSEKFPLRHDITAIGLYEFLNILNTR